MATIENSFKLQLARAAVDSQTTSRADRDSRCLRDLDQHSRILVGHTGDHADLLKLLVLAYQTPVADDFQSRLDQPLYQPSDRLLLRRKGQLIGHVQVSKLMGWFQGQRCPVARLHDFLTLPEYRASDYDSALLETAESTARSEGAILAFVRTDRPAWFEQHNWSCCHWQGHTRANTRAILSHLDAQYTKRRHNHQSLEVRTWRHFELDSIEKIYQQISSNLWGAPQRSLETWQWLVGRKAHDQILIAVDHSSPRSSQLDAESPPSKQPNVIGYAIIRDSCIVEMLTLPGYSAARPLLVARACRDAIDRDHHFVSLHTPASDPMHELLVTAGGSWIADSTATGGQGMFKLLAPERWIDKLYPLLHKRTREADIPRPLEIDFALQDSTYRRLTLTRRSSRLESTASPQSPIECTSQTLQDLLCSNLTFPEAITQGRLRTSHPSILRTLEALFPPKLFWQSPFSLLKL